jgi:hypothetical protein
MYEVYTFHKCASVFLYEYALQISKLDNTFQVYSENKSPPNTEQYEVVKYEKSICCPIRIIPSTNLVYDSKITYIIHIRNPLDVLISRFYAFGYSRTWRDDKNDPVWVAYKKSIQNKGIDKFCMTDIVVQESYKKLFNWLSIYGNKSNVHLSSYEEMKYDFKSWNQKISKIFGVSDHEDTLFNTFHKDFDFIPVKNEDVRKGVTSAHKRNGLSKQYLSELTFETITNLTDIFNKIIPNKFKAFPDFHNTPEKIIIVCFPRSGYNLLHNIMHVYFGMSFCNCNNESTILPYAIETFHKEHDMKLNKSNNGYNKTIILYRKDHVEQLDAYFRYWFCRDKKEFMTLEDHSKCKDDFTPYVTKEGWLSSIYKVYLQWLDKWVNTPIENSLVIEYNDFMRNPERVLNELHFFLKGKNSDDSVIHEIINNLKIEYKNIISTDRYNELSELIKNFS